MRIHFSPFLFSILTNVIELGSIHKWIQYKTMMLNKDFISFISVDKL